MIKCPKCGYENKDDTSWCGLCGEILKREEPTALHRPPLPKEAKPTRTETKIPGWIKFLILVGVVILIYSFIESQISRQQIEGVRRIDKSFSTEVLESDLPVLVDFWAPWCTPCRQIAPIIDELKREYQGRLKVYKVNVDEKPALSKKYKIRGIPTLLFFKNGKVIDRIVGAYPKDEIKRKIDKVISLKK